MDNRKETLAKITQLEHDYDNMDIDTYRWGVALFKSDKREMAAELAVLRKSLIGKS